MGRGDREGRSLRSRFARSRRALTPSPPQPPGRRSTPGAFPSYAYAAVGTLGVLLLVLGIWTPFLASVPGAAYLRVVVAIAGGALAAFGWIRLDQRRRGSSRGPPTPPRGIEGMSSFEVYSPRGDDRASGPRPKTEGFVAPPAHPGAGLFSDHRTRRLRWAVLALVAVLLVAPGLPSVSTAVSAGSGARAASSPAPATPSPTTVVTAPSAGPVPVCSLTYPPLYSTFGGFYPPLPQYSQQSPCKTAHDEVHLTFSSNVDPSGQRFRVPVYLPASGNPGQSATYGDFYLGMVVAGDPNSVDHQSYAELAFTPGGNASSFSWRVGVAVWSLLLNTNCSTGGAHPAVSGLNLSFANSFGCVQDQVNSSSGKVLDPAVPGGQWANVTMIGGASGASAPLSIYFNDSTDAAYSTSFTFSSAHTGSYAFYPAFGVACPTRCVLNWSTPFGLGVGADLCESATCFSYNATAQSEAPPFEVGSPEFWSGLSYSGDYLYLGPTSSTGACSGAGAVVPCDPYAQAGSYPYFTFNGTTIDFGASWNWTTESFGGPYVEFNALGTMNQYVPLFVDRLTNSSRAGYVAPADAFNVSSRVQDFGQVSRVNLSYQQPGASWSNETMSLASGAPSFGTYNASVPTGLDGTVSFRVWATNGAGASIPLPGFASGPATVDRTTIPTVTIGISVTPAGCGGVSVNGGPFLTNGSGTSVLAGFYPVSVNGCYPYRFDRWQTTGGLTVNGTGTTAQLTAHANGTVAAVLTYYRPLDTVHLAIHGCGEILLNESAYGSGTTAYLLDAGTYPLTMSPCGGDAFGGWTVSNPSNLSVLGYSITVRGNGTLTAQYVPTASTSAVGFETDPSSCGGVLLESTGYVTGETVYLANGSYPVGPDPCYGWGFNGTVSTTGSVNVTGSTLGVEGAGVLNYSYYKLTLVTLLTMPASCGGIVWDGVMMMDGAVLNITNHTQHAIAGAPCNGTYLSGWVATGGVTLLGTTAVSVDGPGALQANFLKGTPHEVVEFQTDPATCGSIVFDGTSYADSQFVSVPPDTVASVSAVACSGYGFVGWSQGANRGGVTIVGDTAYVNGSGSITATFHPLVLLVVYTSPAACGSVTIATVAGPLGLDNNMTAELPDGANYAITAVPCAYQTLSMWDTSTGATIANGLLTLSGAATITAVFAPAVYSVRLAVATGGCGQVVLGTTPYTSNSTVGLTAGPYSLSAQPCAGYRLGAWQTTGNLTASGVPAATLTIRGNGTVTAVISAVPPSVSITVPSSAASGSSVVLTATVAVPVPPYNYSYAWSFGDGATATVPSNTTSHTYSTTGTYLVELTVHDPLGRTATTQANLTIVPPPSGSTFGISSLGLVVLGVAGAAVVLAAAVFVVRARRERNAPTEPAAEPTYGTVDEADGPPRP